MGQRCDLCEENKYRDGFECPSKNEPKFALMSALLLSIQLVRRVIAKCKNVSIAIGEI